MKIACLLITHLRAKVELRNNPTLVSTPAIIVERSEGSSRVVDFTPSTHGVSPGMTLEEALSIHPEALVLDADESHYSKVFSQILTSLQDISDRVEGSDLGVAYIRLDGLEHLYGGEARLVNALLNAVPREPDPKGRRRRGQVPRLHSRYGERAVKSHSSIHLMELSFLALHPINLLPISADLKVALHRFGLHTLGDVAHMTETSMTDRFRSEGRKAWHLSSGIDDSPVVPLAHTETIVERTSLPFSSASLELLITIVRTPFSRGLLPNPRCEGVTPTKPFFSAPWRMARPGPESSPSREASGVGSVPCRCSRSRLEEEHPIGCRGRSDSDP